MYRSYISHTYTDMEDQECEDDRLSLSSRSSHVFGSPQEEKSSQQDTASSPVCGLKVCYLHVCGGKLLPITGLSKILLPVELPFHIIRVRSSCFEM